MTLRLPLNSALNTILLYHSNIPSIDRGKLNGPFSNSRDVSEVVLAAGVRSLVTDANEGLQLELLADRVERQDLLGRDVRPHGQVELPGYLQIENISILLFYSRLQI